MTVRLILLRHGESMWSAERRFTGWVDVPLSDLGRAQSVEAGRILREAGAEPQIVFTSLLRRSIETANLALDAADRAWIPVRRSWRLNERHYGALQGQRKEEIRETFGEGLFFTWRRSFSVRPPAIAADSPYNPARDPRYRGEHVPASEALGDVYDRQVPYWSHVIVPELRARGTALVVGHGNSLRALVKFIERISDDAIRHVNVPTGIPFVYELDETTMAPLGPPTFLVDEVPDSGLV